MNEEEDESCLGLSLGAISETYIQAPLMFVMLSIFSNEVSFFHRNSTPIELDYARAC